MWLLKNSRPRASPTCLTTTRRVQDPRPAGAPTTALEFSEIATKMKTRRSGQPRSRRRCPHQRAGRTEEGGHVQRPGSTPSRKAGAGNSPRRDQEVRVLARTLKKPCWSTPRNTATVDDVLGASGYGARRAGLCPALRTGRSATEPGGVSIDLHRHKSRPTAKGARRQAGSPGTTEFASCLIRVMCR